MDEFFNFDSHLNGSKGLIFIGEKLLVYRRDEKPKNYPLFLDLPGGGKEKNETPFDTFRREVKEEFGIEIAESDITYVRRYPSTIVEGEYAYFPVVHLPASAETLIHFGNEGLEYLLLPVDDFLNASDVWPGLQQKTADYLNSIK